MVINTRSGLFSQGLLKISKNFNGPHFVGQIPICACTIYEHNQILISCMILVDYLSHPVIPTLVFLLCQFATFTSVNHITYTRFSSACCQFLLWSNWFLGFLFCAAIKRFNFFLFSHVRLVLCAISLICHLNYLLLLIIIIIIIILTFFLSSLLTQSCLVLYSFCASLLHFLLTAYFYFLRFHFKLLFSKSPSVKENVKLLSFLCWWNLIINKVVRAIGSCYWFDA